jgi:hypothetical protein
MELLFKELNKSEDQVRIGFRASAHQASSCRSKKLGMLLDRVKAGSGSHSTDEHCEFFTMMTLSQ